jgi:hypothetical protein
VPAVIGVDGVVVSEAGWTYRDLALANLSDLLEPADLVNPRINMICAYAELEALFSTLLPPTLVCALASAHAPRGSAGDDVAGAATLARLGVDAAIRTAAQACQCHDDITALQAAAMRARRDERASTTIEELRTAVDAAATFITRLRSLSYPIRCTCAAPTTYQLRDALGVCPPCELTWTCPACSHHSIWFVPSPRH